MNDCRREAQRIQSLEYEVEREREINRQHEEADSRRRAAVEEDRKERLRAADPSNRLYNGEITEFCSAVSTHKYLLSRERDDAIAMDSDPNFGGSAEKGEKTRQQFEGWNKGCDRAIEIYQAVYADAEKGLRKCVADLLRAEHLDNFADCLEQNDYTELAV